MEIKKKIIVDLDVVTVSIWDKKGENVRLAVEFIDRVKQKEFEVITPFYLLEHLIKWKYVTLKEKIEEFYLKNSDSLLTNEDVDERIDSLEIDDEKILLELQSNNVKEEDAFIALITSIFKLDYLVTFNRRHLKNKKNQINEVLKKHGLAAIKIVGPEEV